MSQIIQIIQTERERTADNRAVIHLYQEGTFYRAYNWSAWLCHRFVSQFKVTHKELKNIEGTVLFVGFPVSSFDKFFPDTSLVEVGDKAKDIRLSAASVPDEMTLEIMTTDYETWRSSIPLTVSNEKQKEHSGAVMSQLMSEQKPTSITITSIMQQILAFPLEQKTPLDCMLFIADVKQQLAKLI